MNHKCALIPDFVPSDRFGQAIQTLITTLFHIRIWRTLANSERTAESVDSWSSIVLQSVTFLPLDPQWILLYIVFFFHLKLMLSIWHSENEVVFEVTKWWTQISTIMTQAIFFRMLDMNYRVEGSTEWSFPSDYHESSNTFRFKQRL